MNASKIAYCPLCGKRLRHVPAIGLVQGDEPTPWLRSITDVVNKEGGEHCQRFINHPTRDNYRAWMKGEGLRPMEPGEEARRRPTPQEKERERDGKAHLLAKNLQKSRSLGEINLKQ